MKKKFVRFMVFVVIIAAFIMNKGYLGALHIDGIGNYSSKYIYIINRENKNIEYEKNSNSRTYPASLTKIMTTIVALEHIENLSDIAPVDTDTYQIMVVKNSSMAGFYGKEVVTYRDLLYGTMLPSGGEAANSLAIHVAGSIENFVKLMNEKALELGMENTHFTNVEGLDDDKQYTSAQDMAKLLDYALENGDFRAIFTKKEFVTTKTLDHPNGIVLKSTVLSRLDDIHQDGFEIIGGKSGTTSKAGQCWATLGIKNNQEYICIVMGAPLDDISNPDMKQREDTIKLYKRVE